MLRLDCQRDGWFRLSHGSLEDRVVASFAFTQRDNVAQRLHG